MADNNLHQTLNPEDFEKHVVDETFKLLETSILDEDTLGMLNKDSAKKREITELIKKVANEEYMHCHALKGIDYESMVGIEKVLNKHLDSERMDLIKGGLQIPTYKMDILKKVDNGTYMAYVVDPDGELMMPPTKLNSKDSLMDSEFEQYASIVIEAVMLAMSATGIKISPGKKAIAKAAKIVERKLLADSAFRQALKELKKTFSHSGSSRWDKAKAVFNLLLATNSAGIFMSTVKALCSEMGFLEWAKTAARVTAYIIAAFATGGAALIAKIILTLDDAYEFIKKITNLNSIELVAKELKLE